mgnify:CR=1 FL=1
MAITKIISSGTYWFVMGEGGSKLPEQIDLVPIGYDVVLERNYCEGGEDG